MAALAARLGSRRGGWLVGATLIGGSVTSVRALSTSATSRKVIMTREDPRLGQPTLMIGPERPDSLVVVLHGLGDSARGWESLADMLAPRFPSTRFILPTAPSQPVTLNGGYVMPSWYDLIGLERRDAETCEGIDDSRAAVLDLLDEQYAEEGSKLSPNVTVLAGFSQGGAVALWTGLQGDHNPLAGVVCMSGYLPQPQAFTPGPAALATPVLLLHGEADPVVRFEFALQTEAALKSHKFNVRMESYPELEHSANLEEIEDVSTFLRAVLPPQ